MNVLLPFLLSVSVPQAPAQETDTSLLTYEVNGLKVIHKRRPPTSDVIAVHLYILGGSRNVNAEQAGIEPLILDVAVLGSERYPGMESRRAMARTGSSVSRATGYDWTFYAFSGLKQDFDSTWAVFTDRIMRPTLDSASVEVVRQRMLGRVARRRVSPEDYASFLGDSLAFAGHPYGNPPGGTEGSLRNMSLATIRQYHKEQFITTRMVLVVAGDLSREKVESALSRTLGTLPRGEYVWQMPPPVSPTTRRLVVANRSVRTNYIVATAFGPSRSSPEFDAFARVFRMLGGYAGSAIREDAKLSYAAYMSVYEMAVPHAQFFVSTNNPDSVMRILTNVREFLSADNVSMPRASIREGAEMATRGYLASVETAGGQASALGRAFLYQGDPRMAERAADINKRLTYFDMKRALRTYGRCFQFAYVGDTLLAPREAMLGKDPSCK